jgi:hypothetical protein
MLIIRSRILQYVLLMHTNIHWSYRGSSFWQWFTLVTRLLRYSLSRWPRGFCGWRTAPWTRCPQARSMSRDPILDFPKSWPATEWHEPNRDRLGPAEFSNALSAAHSIDCILMYCVYSILHQEDVFLFLTSNSNVCPCSVMLRQYKLLHANEVWF